MNFIVKFFHEFANPHCEHCREESMDDPVLEELKTELAALRYERDRLLKYILDEPQPHTEHTIALKEEDIQPVLPKIVPWHVRRQMLEEEDRKAATLLRQNKTEQEKLVQEKAIQDLENQLLNVDIPSLDLDKGEVNVQSKSV